ncbi:MAG: hypothetical protein R3F03_12920 [Opitutaceae bacterium]
MVYVRRDIQDKDLIQIVRDWIDVLSQKRYDVFFNALGYSMAGKCASADCIASDLSRYRSELYPGISDFAVTNWRTAKGGNPAPIAEVVWYKPNATRLAGAVTLTLPLNGKWSDATADFILFETNTREGLWLRLEEICIPFRGEQ